MRILRCPMPMDIPENKFHPFLLDLFTVENEIFKKSSVNIQNHIFNASQLSNNQKGKITMINCHVCWLLSLQLRLWPPGGRSAWSKVKIPTWYKWEGRQEDSNWSFFRILFNACLSCLLTMIVYQMKRRIPWHLHWLAKNQRYDLKNHHHSYFTWNYYIIKKCDQLMPKPTKSCCYLGNFFRPFHRRWENYQEQKLVTMSSAGLSTNLFILFFHV